MTNSEIIQLGKWTMRRRIPQGKGPFALIIMLHGWTGNEDAMWVFASRLPEDVILLAPRGLFSSPHGGYSWHNNVVSGWPEIEDFMPAVNQLKSLLKFDNFPEVDLSRIGLLGFSQGAALAYAFGLVYPAAIMNIAGLSGFLPVGSSNLIIEKPLIGKNIFIAHGTQDELVPIERARLAVQDLEKAGGNVTYCEDDVGHKLSASCFRGLQTFFERNMLKS